MAFALVSASTDLMFQPDPWTRARNDYLQKCSLHRGDRQILTVSSPDDLTSIMKDWAKQHAKQSNTRKCLNSLKPLLDGLNRFAPAIDVFCNAEPLGILSLLWGSLRLVLIVRAPCNWLTSDLFIVNRLRKISTNTSKTCAAPWATLVKGLVFL